MKEILKGLYIGWAVKADDSWSRGLMPKRVENSPNPIYSFFVMINAPMTCLTLKRLPRLMVRHERNIKKVCTLVERLRQTAHEREVPGLIPVKFEKKFPMYNFFVLLLLRLTIRLLKSILRSRGMSWVYQPWQSYRPLLWLFVRLSYYIHPG